MPGLSRDLLKHLDKIAEGSVVRASEAKALDYDRLPTGSVRLDLALGGGLPMGRLVEFYGRESHGKTTALLKAVAEIQKQGRLCALVQSEEFNAAYAEMLGVDLGELWLSRPDSVEQMIDLVETLIYSREVALIGVDSITGFVPTRVSERSASEETIGIEAKMNNLWARKVVAAMAPGDLRKEENRPWCCLVYVNQMRTKMGGRISFDDVSGGMGLRFFKSISVEFKRTDWLNEKGGKAPAKRDHKCGLTIAMQATKNKTDVPFAFGEVDYYFEDCEVAKAGQYDLVKELVIVAIEKGAVEQAGAFYTVDGTRYRGRDALVEAIRTKPEVVTAIGKELGMKFMYYKPSKPRARK